MPRLLLCCVCLALLSLLPVTFSYADSFVITEGTVGHGLTIIGFRGSFDFSGASIQASGLILRAMPVGVPMFKIAPGTSFSSFSTVVREPVDNPFPPSIWSVNGVPFSGQGAAYELQFAGGPITLPSTLLPSVSVEFPTTFSGTLFQCPTPTPCDSFAFLVHSLSGDVIGSITFSEDKNFFPGTYLAQQFDATFVSAIPEAASIALVISGLVGLGAWRRFSAERGSR